MTRHGGTLTQEAVLTALRGFWFDTALSAGRQSLGSLKEVAAPDRILFGSDWPYCPEIMTRDMLDARYGSDMFTNAEQDAIDCGNALRLFPRFA
jgi:predicted TIM-barrel fold metal-dependent hydrolase